MNDPLTCRSALQPVAGGWRCPNCGLFIAAPIKKRKKKQKKL